MLNLDRTSPRSDRLTSFLDLSSSQLKLLRRRARKRLSTMKLPITSAGRKMARQDSATPWKRGERHDAFSDAVYHTTTFIWFRGGVLFLAVVCPQSQRTSGVLCVMPLPTPSRVKV